MTITHSNLQSLPLAPGTWGLDAPHCTVEFVVRHMGISKVRGRFRGFEATVDVGDALETSVLRASVDMASVDTGDADRDAHLRGADFFDVDRHPRMMFESTSITPVGDDAFDVAGDLTIKGVTGRETLSVRFDGTEVFPGDESLHAGFEASTSIRRTDYGVDFNVPLGAGGFVISDTVRVELDVQLLAPGGRG